MVIKEDLSIMDKLTILSDAAKYDVSCSSSGVERGNNGKGIAILKRVEYATALVQMAGVFLF